MKKFLLKILPYPIALVLIGLVLMQVKKYDFYGNTKLNNKVDYFTNNQHKINTLYVGSSRTYRHLNPLIIDSVTTGKTHSFNIGMAATYLIENEYLLENLENNQRLDDIKYLIVEAQPNTPIAKINAHTSRTYYYHSLSTANLSYQFNQNDTIKYNNFSSYFYYLLNVCNLQKITSKSDKNSNYTNEGFIPLDDEKGKGIKQRHQNFLKDTLQISKKLNATKNFVTNPAYKEYLQNLKNYCDSKGIVLVLYQPPLTQPVLQKLIQEMQLPYIDMYDPIENAELYRSENVFDAGHLNNKGATLLSQEFGKKLNQIIK